MTIESLTDLPTGEEEGLRLPERGSWPKYDELPTKGCGRCVYPSGLVRIKTKDGRWLKEEDYDKEFGTLG